MAGDARKVQMIAIPCPDCGELAEEPIDQVTENGVIPCSLCGGLIDLAAEECREALVRARALRQGQGSGGAE
ncbi:MAG: hypothetical protein HY056_02620 [Proteobacteria bacterium]|nr:hypothetical protein [Pseudomonadota bacterium]